VMPTGDIAPPRLAGRKEPLKRRIIDREKSLRKRLRKLRKRRPTSQNVSSRQAFPQRWASPKASCLLGSTSARAIQTRQNQLTTRNLFAVDRVASSTGISILERLTKNTVAPCVITLCVRQLRASKGTTKLMVISGLSPLATE
jgi:hypothetical protein